jgi:hypothetical protein
MANTFSRYNLLYGVTKTLSSDILYGYHKNDVLDQKYIFHKKYENSHPFFASNI